MKASDFGSDFSWGVSSSAYQTEGAHDMDGKGKSIWDVFSNTRGKVHQNHNGNIACDFFHRYKQDILLLKKLGIKNFRFSISWPRLLPEGTGRVNEKGIKFYHDLIDCCLENGIEPWITLYHWDLPYELEKKGGWTNRKIIDWFSEYAKLCSRNYGSKVKYWMVLNEPVAFTGTGYFLGMHAPGRRGLKNFLPAIHHAALCQSVGFHILKNNHPSNEIGTTFSFSNIEPLNNKPRHVEAARRADVLLNRLALEPVLGKMYPKNELRVLQGIDKYIFEDDLNQLQVPFDFIGAQVYTREVVRRSFLSPYVGVKPVSAEKRKVKQTVLGWEIHPPSIYEILKKVSAYSGVKKIIVTENGAAFNDFVFEGKVEDEYRVSYYDEHLRQVKRAQDEGINVQGYFIWSFTDNFEWSEGYYPRFGIVHVNFETQERIIKNSGWWYSQFLKE